MSILDIIIFLGGIATFLFGMTTMTSGLQKISGGKLESVMNRLTGNIVTSVAVGALMAGLLHSSAATTIMCVGFVNSGIMKLEQTVGVIMGANIGTTITSQILRLGDLSSDNLFVSLMTPKYFGPMLAVVGIIFYSFLKSGKQKNIGQFVMGLGLLFIGMVTMEESISPLAEVPAFQQLLVMFSNPILGILAGALITALLQSSTASVGVLQAMTSTGVVTFSIALPIICGQNIGTCITSLISSAGASKNAKRTAMIHLYFNVIGTVFFLLVIYGIQAALTAITGSGFPFWNDILSKGGIANIHTTFNVVCTLVILPFNKQLVKLVKRTIPGDEQDERLSLLDERFLTTPAVALEQARTAIVGMGDAAQENFHAAVELLTSYDQKKMDRLNELENTIDMMESKTDSYLIRLNNSRTLTEAESMQVSELLHTLSDYERIGDYAVNIAEIAQALHEDGIHFSGWALAELKNIFNAVDEILNNTLRAYTNYDKDLAFRTEPLEEVIDLMTEMLKTRHVERLKSGACTVELGARFLELLIDLSRISDHCSNVAFYVLRADAPAGLSQMDNSHEYFHRLHEGGDRVYNQLYDGYRRTYLAPLANQTVS